MYSMSANSLYTDYQWLNRVNENREYGSVVPRIKTIAKRLGVRVTGKKKDALLSDTLHAVVSEIKKTTRSSPWTKRWPELIVTTDRAYVRQLINTTELDLCSRKTWTAMNMFSSSRRPYGTLENSGVNRSYVRNVMHATNRNNSPIKSQRRVYLILRATNTTVGFAECRFPPGAKAAHLTLICSKPGLGKLLVTAVERVSKGMGYTHVTVEPTTASAGVWSRYGYRTDGTLMTRNLSGVSPMTGQPAFFKV